MRIEELPQVAARLNELAEFYRVKAETNAALKIWFDCLKPFTLATALNVLTDWPRMMGRYPTANLVVDLCGKRVSDDLEASSRANEPRIGVREALDNAGGTELAALWMPKIRALLGFPKSPPKLWLWLLRERERREEKLSPSAMGAWREQLGYARGTPIEQTYAPDARMYELVDAMLAWRDVDVRDEESFLPAHDRVRRVLVGVVREGEREAALEREAICREWS
jgi:hypothetical protein